MKATKRMNEELIDEDENDVSEDNELDEDTSSSEDDENEEETEEKEIELKAMKEEELTLAQQLQLIRIKIKKLNKERYLLQEHIKHPNLKEENPEHLKELDVFLRERLEEAEEEKRTIKERIIKTDATRMKMHEELEDDIIKEAEHRKHKFNQSREIEQFKLDVLNQKLVKRRVDNIYERYLEIKHSTILTPTEKAARYRDITGVPFYQNDKMMVKAIIAFNFYVSKIKMGLLMGGAATDTLEKLRAILTPLEKFIWNENETSIPPIPLSLDDCDKPPFTPDDDPFSIFGEAKLLNCCFDGDTCHPKPPKKVECIIDDLEDLRTKLVKKHKHSTSREEKKAIDRKIKKIEQEIERRSGEVNEKNHKTEEDDMDNAEKKFLSHLGGVSLYGFTSKSFSDGKSPLFRVGNYVLAEKRRTKNAPEKFEIGRITGIDDETGIVMMKTENDNDVAVVYPKFDRLYLIGISRDYYGFDNKGHHDRFKKHHPSAFKYVSSLKHHKYHHQRK